MAKKQKCPEFENHERWLISFADMLTLLFATFVVLYALNLDNASSDDESLAGSIQEAFNKPLDDIPLDKRTAAQRIGWGIFENMHGQSFSPSERSFQTPSDHIKMINAEFKQFRMELENRLYGPNMHRRDKGKDGFERIVSVHQTARGFRVRLLARHFYSPGSSDIRPESKKELDEVAKLLKELGRKITLEGHTDSATPSGMSNWELSSLRASKVLLYFLSKHNFPPTLLAAAGYADTFPVAENSTEEGRALNRRIEIQVHYDPEPLLQPE